MTCADNEKLSDLFLFIFLNFMYIYAWTMTQNIIDSTIEKIWRFWEFFHPAEESFRSQKNSNVSNPRFFQGLETDIN